MKGVSLIICCYNSVMRLPETLKHVAGLKTSNILLEVIIVDNASSDETARIAKKEWHKYSNSTDFKIVAEPKPGLSHARMKGINVSKYDYICFVDDDNWLDKNYLNELVRIFENYPDVAIVGGFNSPVYETTPPAGFAEHEGILAVSPENKPLGFVNAVFGAGMGIRKKVLLDLYENGFITILSGRTKNNLTSSEDNEICDVVRSVGWQILYSPALQLRHFITKGRISMEYIERLTKGISSSFVYLDLYKLYRIPKGSSQYYKQASWLFNVLKYLSPFLVYGSKYLVFSILNDERKHSRLKAMKNQLFCLQELLVNKKLFNERVRIVEGPNYDAIQACLKSRIRVNEPIT